MKKPFDRIVGPEGEWKAPEPGDEVGEREEFLVRCLNAAVNLRGVMTYGEFCELYNHYAGNHDAPVSDPLDERELDAFMSRVADCEEGDGTPMDRLLDDWGVGFSCWRDDRDGAKLVVRCDLIDAKDDVKRSNAAPTLDEIKALADARVAAARDEFAKLKWPVLDEEAFLAMEYIDDDFDDENDDFDDNDNDGDQDGK